MSSLRETIPLQKVKILKKSIAGTIGTLFVCAFLSVFFCIPFFADFDELPDWLQTGQKYLLVTWILVVFLLLACNPIYQYFYFKRYFYDMDEKNIIIRKGVLAQKEITLPFSRITDVYVDQDLLDAAFKISDVHISTPTEQSGQFAHIDGVNKEGSQQLRQMILDRIHSKDS